MPFRQVDAAPVEKQVDSFEPRAAVEVRAVVRVGVEGDIQPVGLLRESEQERVEGIRPRSRLQSAAVGKNAVEVEQSGTNLGRKPEHLPADGDQRQPRRRLYACELSHACE